MADAHIQCNIKFIYQLVIRRITRTFLSLLLEKATTGHSKHQISFYHFFSVSRRFTLINSKRIEFEK